MKKRIYLNNELISYLLGVIKGKRPKNNLVTLVEMASLVFISEIKTIQIEFLVSEESLAEIRNLPATSLKRRDLEKLYFKLKQGKPVIRNSAVSYDDKIATWDSPDIYWGHPYNDTDLNKIREFLRSKGNKSDFDARYIANAMLSENKIDVLLTADKKTIWDYRREIKEKFGVTVQLPSELAEYLKFIR